MSTATLTRKPATTAATTTPTRALSECAELHVVSCGLDGARRQTFEVKHGERVVCTTHVDRGECTDVRLVSYQPLKGKQSIALIGKNMDQNAWARDAYTGRRIHVQSGSDGIRSRAGDYRETHHSVDL